MTTNIKYLINLLLMTFQAMLLILTGVLGFWGFGSSNVMPPTTGPTRPGSRRAMSLASSRQCGWPRFSG